MPNDTNNLPTLPLHRRLPAYAMVLVIPALCFVVLSRVGYGAGPTQLHGVQELVPTPTNERLELPDFSLLARFVHGYAAAPGYGMTERRLAEFDSAATGPPPDVLVFGSSHAYRGFDPRIFARHGVSLFNLGTTGQTPMASRWLINELGPKVRGKLAIIEATPFQLQAGSDSALTTRDLALNRPRSWESLRLAAETEDFDTLRLVSSYLVGSRPRLVETAGGAPLDVATYCWYVAGGYCQWGSVGSAEQVFRPFDFVPSATGLADQADVVRLLRERGLDVVFVIAPIPRQTIQAAENFDEGIAAVAGLAADLSVPLIDYTSPALLDELGLEHPTHYYDGDHMNQAGVDIFDEHLVGELQRRGLLE